MPLLGTITVRHSSLTTTMNKYANPRDEQRIKEAIAKAVCSGQSVFAVDENGETSPEFKNFNMNEVAICASDMIADRLLIEYTRTGSVFVVNSSNGYKPTSVIPSQGLKSWLSDLEAGRKDNLFLVKKRDDIILLILSVILNQLVNYFIKLAD